MGSIPIGGTMELSFDEWLNFGIKNNWISPISCATHDGVPSTEEEESSWEDGGDPCQFVVRIWNDGEAPSAFWQKHWIYYQV